VDWRRDLPRDGLLARANHPFIPGSETHDIGAEQTLARLQQPINEHDARGGVRALRVGFAPLRRDLADAHPRLSDAGSTLDEAAAFGCGGSCFDGRAGKWY
jgi:hypothetical protein